MSRPDPLIANPRRFLPGESSESRLARVIVEECSNELWAARETRWLLGARAGWARLGIELRELDALSEARQQFMRTRRGAFWAWMRA